MPGPRRLKKISLVVPLFLAALPAGIPGTPVRSRAFEAAAAPAGAHRTCTTQFPLAESPVLEGGRWEGGRTVGLDWADVATTPGLAFGIESGVNGFDDSTALLTGPGDADQTAKATGHPANQGEKAWEEVELRLRSSLSAHRATGYEINFECRKTGNAHSEIVRWNGPLGDFTYLSRQVGGQFGVAEGDVIKATIVGSVITVFKNGVQVAQARDGTFATGQPGMGFDKMKGTGSTRDYAFSRFSACDQ